MTKYILAGGADRKHASYAASLKIEIAKAIHNPVKVLSCFFAEPPETWQTKFTDRQGWLQQTFGEDAIITLADPVTFREQVAGADIVYLHGGQNELLTQAMRSFPDAVVMFKDKIVIGSSAGAIWLSNKAWTCDARKVIEGTGVTSCNTLVHYESDEYSMDDQRGPIDWERAKAELKAAVGTDEEVTPLREGEFIIIEQ